jgi:hypothetical protein
VPFATIQNRVEAGGGKKALLMGDDGIISEDSVVGKFQGYVNS